MSIQCFRSELPSAVLAFCKSCFGLFRYFVGLIMSVNVQLVNINYIIILVGMFVLAGLRGSYFFCWLEGYYCSCYFNCDYYCFSHCNCLSCCFSYCYYISYCFSYYYCYSSYCYLHIDSCYSYYSYPCSHYLPVANSNQPLPYCYPN